MNFSQLILDNKKLDTKTALNFKEDNEWKSYSWKEFHDLIMQTAHSLKKLGVQPNDNVAIYADNIPQWMIMNFAILSTGAVTVPIYGTLTADQAKYIIEEADIKIVLAGNQKQYDNLLEVYSKSTSIEHIIAAKNTIEIKSKFSSHFHKLIQNESAHFDVYEKDDDEIASIIYTSGTTGEPKGVMLSHGGFINVCEAHIKFFNIYPSHENSLVFLPLSHVFENCWSSFVLSCGGELSFCEYPKEIAQYLLEVKPTTMCSVPRLFQKIYNSINEKIENSSKAAQKFFKWSISVGAKVSELKRKEEKIPLSLALKYNLANKLAFKKVKEQLGGRLWFIPVGGASITSDITRFFDAIGIHLTIGYGLTETMATVTAFPFTHYEHGTAGKPVTGVQVAIGDEDEVLIKGYGVFKGYYKKEEETQKVFTKDGWFKTGDAGKFDEKGNLIIVDRIKDLLKTSNGKYVSPQPIENMLTNDNYIQQAVIIGDNQPYVTALIVPNFEALKKFAKNLNIKFNSTDELVSIKGIKDFYNERINQLQAHLAGFEQIKKFQLLPSDFDMNSGEITPTLKVRRKIVLEKFKSLIEDMYKK
ncbi:long-chain fatty acid--CoA ligase [Apibacter sp. HY039]|uniref:AMP-dependent synthetase/ligase n=1 Tax=Apibacter sp. HY039 TaxID=2501476 RepID=UPI000FEC00D1|nr:long-chain fatty acid--CoA ligase [Apibacter sp. HY039]